MDAGAGLFDAAGNALDAALAATWNAANPLSDLVALEPYCSLNTGNCAATCTYGFSSAKNGLLVECRLELDVQSADRGTATLEAALNSVTLMAWSYDFTDGAGDAYCQDIPGLAVPGLGGLALCLNLDPDQTGSFTITSEVIMEPSLRISLPLFDDIDYRLGNERLSWSCPNTPLIVGCLVGAIVLSGLSCCGCCRRRKALYPSRYNPQVSVEMPNASGSGHQAGATPTSPAVGVVVSAS